MIRSYKVTVLVQDTYSGVVASRYDVSVDRLDRVGEALRAATDKTLDGLVGAGVYKLVSDALERDDA